MIEGFQDAVGDAIALSVSTPKHLRKIGLLPEEPDDTQSEINNLFRKVQFINKLLFMVIIVETYWYIVI